MKAKAKRTAIIAILALAGCNGEETDRHGTGNEVREITLTAASSHAPSLPWVGTIPDYVIPELDRRIADDGLAVSIRWTQAYGGALYKWQETLEAVEIGTTDIGWVGAIWEASKLPLQQVTYNSPFVTDSLVDTLEIFNKLHREIPAMNQAWLNHGTVFLGASGVETYHLMTNFPARSLDDLDGRKILAPGPAATWLEGTGAVAVNGGLTTYYTDIQTGVADGVLTILSGAYPYKIHEVAPYIALIDIGAQFNGGLAINKATFDGLPPEIQDHLRNIGEEYSAVMAAKVNERLESAIAGMKAEGAIFIEWSEEDRRHWIEALPNLSDRWVANNEQRGLPARRVRDAWLDELRKRGIEPDRAWDK